GDGQHVALGFVVAATVADQYQRPSGIADLGRCPQHRRHHPVVDLHVEAPLHDAPRFDGVPNEVHECGGYGCCERPRSMMAWRRAATTAGSKLAANSRKRRVSIASPSAGVVAVVCLYSASRARTATGSAPTMSSAIARAAAISSSWGTTMLARP